MKRGRHLIRWSPQDWRTSRVRARSVRMADPMLRLIYLEALSALAEAGGTLPSDPEALADILALSPDDIARCLPILDALARQPGSRGGLIVEDGSLRNRRITDDIAADREYRESQAVYGRQGAAKRGRPLVPKPPPAPPADEKPAREDAKLRVECRELLAELSRRTGQGQDVLLYRASRTSGGKTITNLEGCSSEAWLRVTRDRLLEQRLVLGPEPSASEGVPEAEAEAEAIWRAAFAALPDGAQRNPGVAGAVPISVDSEMLTLWVRDEAWVTWVGSSWGDAIRGALAPRGLRLRHGGEGDVHK